MKHIRFAMDLELVEPDTENLFKPSRKEISLWSIAPLVQFDTHQCLKEERWTARPSEVQTLRVNFKDKIQKIHQNGWKFHREMFSLFNTSWSVQFSLFVCFSQGPIERQEADDTRVHTAPCNPYSFIWKAVQCLYLLPHTWLEGKIHSCCSWVFKIAPCSWDSELKICCFIFCQLCFSHSSPNQMEMWPYSSRILSAKKCIPL